MSEEFEVVGNVKYYEVEGMICTGNSTQGLAKNALISDVYGPLFIPETITFFGVKRKVELIGNSSFQGCNADSVYIPRFVKEIRRDAFINCKILNKAVFTENSKLYFIGRGAFRSDSNLTNLYIPPSVKYIQFDAFGVISFSVIYFYGTNKITNDVFCKNHNAITRKIYVTEQYQGDTFGGIEVQEKKITNYVGFYPKKCFTNYRKQLFNINLLFVINLIS